MAKAINGIDSWKPNGTCRKCGIHPATEMWSSEGSIAAIHGCYEFRCRGCCLKEQLAHARSMVDRVVALELDLADWESQVKA